MTVKIAVLKSGEQILCDIKEGFDEEKIITYILENPCTIELVENYSKQNENNTNIILNKWPKFSEDNFIAIVTDFLATVVEPNSFIKKIYEEKFLDGNNKNTTTNERGNFNL